MVKSPSKSKFNLETEPRLQSALEYMMTYGWAILIIVIVAGVLYSLGIFNPSANSGATSTGFNPFTVLAQACGPSIGLRAQVGNRAGIAVGVNWIAVTTSSGLSLSTINSTADKNGNSILVGSVWKSYQSITNGGSFQFNGTTFGNATAAYKGEFCTTPGARYSATIQIGINESTTLGNTKLVLTGTIAGTAAST